ncbi:hypothetical protein NP493_321g02001 [Ridgeia piscesae]|uniref:CUB domain-containing protein n=1 Tax=Ridgeia piscesae TaxID=27915 RepID=A0AAD9NWD0_RIDPI|nr:hypothetical protein NP493_321g02001 [Ridgeia piscesae]
MMALQCDETSHIRILEDVFKVAPSIDLHDVHTSCSHKSAGCSLAPPSGVVRRYCEGRRVCRHIQVAREYCGDNMTNYELVTYECVADVDIKDICRQSSFDSASGYLATTNFPSEYPPNLHCACSLTTIQDDDSDVSAMVQLEVVHFVVKYDVPCNDWLEIVTPNDKWRVCGAYRSTVKTAAVNITFHSDQDTGHEGVWMRYSVVPPDSGSIVRVECSNRESHVPYEILNGIRRHRGDTIDIANGLTIPGVSTRNPTGEGRDTGQGSAVLPEVKTVSRLGRGQHSQTESRPVRQVGTTLKRRLVIGTCVVTVILSLAALLVLLLFAINRKKSKRRGNSTDRLQQRVNSMRLYNSISLPSTVNYSSVSRGQCSVVSHVQQPDDVCIDSDAICQTMSQPSYADCSSVLYAQITTTFMATESNPGGSLSLERSMYF